MGKRTKSLIKFLLQTFYGKWDFFMFEDEREIERERERENERERE